MKKSLISTRIPGLLVAAAATLSLCAAVAPAHAADVGVSVQISQPGVYGRIDIGQFPRPQVVVQQPVIVVQQPQRPSPVYMWVPPGHQKNWKKHCRDYGACGVPVYFVQDQWYDNHVRKGPKGDKHNGKHNGKHDGRHNGQGNGQGNGKG